MARPRLSPQDHLFAKIRDGTFSFLDLAVPDLDAWLAHCRQDGQGYNIPGDPPPLAEAEVEPPHPVRGLGLTPRLCDASPGGEGKASPTGLLCDIIAALRRRLDNRERSLDHRLMMWLACLRANLRKTCQMQKKWHGRAVTATYAAAAGLNLAIPASAGFLSGAPQWLALAAALALPVAVGFTGVRLLSHYGRIETGFLTGATRLGMAETELALHRHADRLAAEQQDAGHALASIRDRLTRQTDAAQYRAEIAALLDRMEQTQQRLADSADLTAIHVRMAGMIRESLESQYEDQRLNWRPGKGLMAFRNLPRLVWRMRDLCGLGIAGTAALLATSSLSLPVTLAAMLAIALGTTVSAVSLVRLQDLARFPLSGDGLQTLAHGEALQCFQADITGTARLTEAFITVLKRLLDEENRPR